MRKLRIEQCFANIQTIYEQLDVTWTEECAELSINADNPSIGQLTVWQEAVEPEQIFVEIEGLERKINQFLLAMQVMGNARLRKRDEATIKYYAKDGCEFEISKEFPQIIESILKHERGEPYVSIYATLGGISVEAVATNSRVPLPKILPQATLDFERLIGIFTSAEDFSGPYLVEHQFRNYFLIMEELIKLWNLAEPAFYPEIEEVRNFVSHAKCEHRRTKKFIEDKFPNAIFKKNGVEYAQFDRTQNTHINFIWPYRDKAYFWVKDKLKELSILANNS